MTLRYGLVLIITLSGSCIYALTDGTIDIPTNSFNKPVILIKATYRLSKPSKKVGYTSYYWVKLSVDEMNLLAKYFASLDQNAAISNSFIKEVESGKAFAGKGLAIKVLKDLRMKKIADLTELMQLKGKTRDGKEGLDEPWLGT